MYQRHFGLQEAPFGITPNPAFFYAGNTRGEILEALLYAVLHGEGIVKVTGEVGSGKTMLCRMLESQLPPSVDVIYLANPSLARHEVVYAIAGELELEVGALRVDEVIRLLHAELIARHVAGKQVLLLVEEAQAMPLETLEEIRLFSNLETARHKLLQIVLFGQPELDASLNLPSMRQLKERITHSFAVPAMPASVIPDFLAFRMQAAGYRGPAVFSARAVRHIARTSRGIVRRINILADKALMAAFADDARAVEARHVRAAARDSAFGNVPLFGRRSLAAIAVLLALLGAAGALLWQAPPAPAAPAQAAGALLRQCSAATRSWLRDEPGENLSLVITAMPTANGELIERFLLSTRKAIGLQQVHAYPLRVGAQELTAIVYGSFASRADAEAAALTLSQQWGFRPQLRALATIRAEAQAAGKGELW